MICLLIYIISHFLQALTAEQKAQIHTHFEAVGKICVKDNPIGAKDIESLRARQKPSGENAPCFLACLMKNIGFVSTLYYLIGTFLDIKVYFMPKTIIVHLCKSDQHHYKSSGKELSTALSFFFIKRFGSLPCFL